MAEDKEAELVRAVFRGAHGQQLLAEWRQMFVEQRIFRPGYSLEECAYREAMRGFVKRIEDMIDGSSN